MASEEKTRLVLEGEVRGFDKVQQVIDETVGAVEGKGGQPGIMASLDKALAGIADSLDKVEQSISGVVKAAGSLKRQSEREGGGGGAEKREKPDPSFLRGLLQGVGVAQYLPGVTPGALARQAAGNLAGSTARGVLGGLGSSPFSGISGVSRAFSAIPMVGGVASGMSDTAIAAVQEALELQMAERDAHPFLNHRLGGNDMAAARERLMQRGPSSSTSYPSMQFEATPNGPTQPIFNHKTGKLEMVPIYGNASPSYADLKAADEQAVGRGVTTRQSDRSFQAEVASAVAAARSSAVFGSNFEGLGVRYGLDRTELTRSTSELMQGRGGFHDPNSGGLQAALAGQAGFGVGLGTSGTLLRGSRIGAISGRSGGEGDQLAQMIGDALRMGLEGSEVTEHLQRMADGIRRFETTGIAIAPGAVGAVAGTLMRSGMANGVAAGRGSAFVGSVQARAGEGLPTNALDFAALVHLGGYGGGGTEDALSARARLTRGQFAPGGVDALTKSFSSQLGTGDFGRAFGVEQGFKRLGLSLNPDEAMALDARSRGGELSKAQQEAIARAESRMQRGFSGVDELESAADGAVGGGLQRQAGIRNIRRSAGQTAMEATQAFEESASRAAAAFAPVIDKMKELAPLLGVAVDALESGVRSFGVPVVKPGQ